MQFTITNPAANTTALNAVAFTDTLPAGLTVASASATVCGGTLTNTNPTTIHLSGATVNTNSQCIFSVTVTGAAAGSYSNTVSGAGAITSTTSGIGATGPASNTANLTVAAPPAITKLFGAASVPLNGTTSLTFTIQNPNGFVALTGIAFTDNLPAGLAYYDRNFFCCFANPGYAALFANGPEFDLDLVESTVLDGRTLKLIYVPHLHTGVPEGVGPKERHA